MTGMTKWLVSVLILGAMIGCGDEVETSDRDLRILERGALFEQMHLEKAVLVDVRPLRYYQAGHIPGAIHMPLNHMRSLDPRLTGNKTIVVYAAGWNDPLSTAGVKRLISLGYYDVFDYKGGVRDWQDAGRVLTTGRLDAGRAETED